MNKNKLTDKEKLEICIIALMDMGKFLRENPPPLECNIPFEIYIKILTGGFDRDPNGLEFVSYFLNKAEEKWVAKNATH